jgi:molybdopterin synthase sulfur carrier subunit
MDSQFEIKLFGLLAETLGANSIQVPLFDSSDALLDYLCEHYPILKEKVFMLAVDKNIIHENCTITSNSEVALMPPFSGG